MSDKVLLSICIATYNRSDILKKLLEELIEFKSEKIEIVVVDNASTDDTVAKIREINDSRIKVFKNHINIGGQNNFIKALECAAGKYALYCNDRDHLIIDRLEELLNILEKNDISFAKTSCFHNQKNTKIVSFPVGFESLINVGFCHHPTGLIFNKELLEEKINLKRFYDYKGVYLWDFIAYELSFYKPTLYINNGLWKQASDEMKIKNKSHYGRAWFDPVSRIDEMNFLCLYFNDLFDKFNVDVDNRKKAYEKLFKYFLYASTYIYNFMRTDEVEISHYGLDGKGISFKEYLSISKNIYLEFNHRSHELHYNKILNIKGIYYFSLVKNYMLMKILTPKNKKKILKIIEG